jgi:hypothetical protein
MKALDEITRTKKLQQRENLSEIKEPDTILHVLAMTLQILEYNLELILFATTFSLALRGLKSNENTISNCKSTTSSPTHLLSQTFPVTDRALMPLSL